MKTLIFSLVLACGALHASGQENSTPSAWSAGLIVLNENDNAGRFSPNVLPGMIVRRDFRNFTLRAAGELTRNSVSTFKSSETFEKGFTRELVVRAGIEKGVTFRKHFRPYAALDIAGSFYSSNSRCLITHLGINQEHTLTRESFGFIPALGIEFLLTKHLSFSVETRMRVMREHAVERTIYYTGNIDTRPVESKTFATRFNRLGALTLHVRF